MDVTCERCKTGYEFDDALVSERGTSVRCTTCGHTFKVRRGGTATSTPTASGKERWLVRTIDGRELEFRALRELQAAIGKGLVRRDDVLARENGRPRRLGSIAELDPFFSARTLTAAQQGGFSKTSIGVGPPRQRSHTPPGLGGEGPSASVEPARSGAEAMRAAGDSPLRFPMGSGTTEGSVIIPLAAALARAPSEPPKKPEARAGSAPRNPLPSFSSTAGAVAGAPAPSDVVGFEGSGPPSNEDITHQVSRAELEAQIREAESMATADSVAASLPKPSVPPPAPEPAAPSPAAPPAPPAAPAREVVTQRMAAKARVRPPQPAISFEDRGTADSVATKVAPAPVGDPSPASSGDAPSSADGPISSSASAHLPEMLPPAPDPTAPMRAPTPARATSPAAPSADTPDTSSTPTPTPPRDSPAGRSSLADIRPSTASLVNLTPTPADVRYSYVQEHGRSSGDGRFSGAAESRRVGSARWIFALLLVGAVAVGGAIVARRFFSGDTKGGLAAGDERVTKLLASAEKALGAGDLETAKEEVDRASGLAESDVRVAELAARIANERAELPWLELRFLPSEDAGRAAAKQRLGERVARAKLAVGRAAELAASDKKVLRERIDTLRLAGELPAARALVPQVADASSEPRTQVVLAALDLAEEAPPFATLVPRLSKAVLEEGESGRVRLLLVYALARSGDVTRARQELEKVRQTHPLRALALAFLDRTGQGVPPSLDIESLPDATPAASVELGEGDVPADFRKALELASQALGRGDHGKAEKLYRAALSREPGNVEALAGLGHVARGRGQTGAAIEAYKRSVEAAPGYLPALLPLADMLWDGGDRAAAQDYYRRIVQIAPGSGAADRARERLGAADPPKTAEPVETAAPPASAPTAPETGDPPDAPDPPPPEPPPPPPPPPPSTGAAP